MGKDKLMGVITHLRWFCMYNPLEKVESEKAPKAIGPYSQAVVVGGFLFASGQIGMSHSTGKMVKGGVVEQTKQALDNIDGVLAERNIGLARVVKATVYLKDMADFQAMNDVYSARFRDEPRPARETIQAAALPKDALVEISCIAYIGD